MKYTNFILLSFALLLIPGLIYSPISIYLVLAAPPHPCFDGAQDYNCNCGNNPAKLTATCCWYDPITGGSACQTCEINTDTGDFESCTSKAISDSSTIAPPPSGNAPPTSTEKCPDNAAVDKNGNCSPVVQSPEESSNDNNNEDNNKPQFPRGQVLNDLQFNQDMQISPSE